MNFKNIVLSCIAILFSVHVMAQDSVLGNISTALQTGNAAQLAGEFDSNVEVTIVDSDDVYSKSQAEMILKKFFNSNSPQSFKFIHQGNSAEGSHYGIGSYISVEGNKYRTYVYVKQKGDKYLIQEIRFEND